MGCTWYTTSTCCRAEGDSAEGARGKRTTSRLSLGCTPTICEGARKRKQEVLLLHCLVVVFLLHCLVVVLLLHCLVVIKNKQKVSTEMAGLGEAFERVQFGATAWRCEG